MKIKFNIDFYPNSSLEIIEARLLSTFQEVKDLCTKSDGFCDICEHHDLCNDLYIALAKIDVKYSRNKGER